MKEWHFYDKVYRRWVCLFIGDYDKFYEDLKNDGYTGLEAVEYAKGLCVELNDGNNSNNQRCTIIWMPVFETATLVHEITHLVMMQFDQVGVPISRDNTESFAFYTEYWFTEMLKARRKFPDGKPPKEAKRG